MKIHAIDDNSLVTRKWRCAGQASTSLRLVLNKRQLFNLFEIDCLLSLPEIIVI